MVSEELAVCSVLCAMCEWSAACGTPCARDVYACGMRALCAVSSVLIAMCARRMPMYALVVWHAV